MDNTIDKITNDVDALI
jgi:hypothetical protein